MVKRRFKEAGVVDDAGTKSTHSLRHSFVTNAVRRAREHGRSPLAVQAAARHKNMDTTMGYYHEVSRLDSPIEDVIDFSNGK
jgi:integrase